MDEKHITPDDLIYAITHAVDEGPFEPDDVDDEIATDIAKRETLAEVGVYYCVLQALDNEHCLGDVHMYLREIDGLPGGRTKVSMPICESHASGFEDPTAWILQDD